MGSTKPAEVSKILARSTALPPINSSHLAYPHLGVEQPLPDLRVGDLLRDAIFDTFECRSLNKVTVP